MSNVQQMLNATAVYTTGSESVKLKLISTLSVRQRKRSEGHRVEIDKEALIGFIREIDHRITEVKLDIALPGEKTRIMPVKDVVEPRVKVSGKGHIFPGRNAGENDIVGEGRTHVLKGMAVMTTGKVVGFQEGIIDMSGPGAGTLRSPRP